MGYYASACGHLKLNDYGKQNIKKLEKLIKENEGDCGFDEVMLLEGDQLLEEQEDKSLELFLYLFEDGSYHEDEVRRFLSKVTPYVKDNQEVEFVGEDHCHWRFIKLNGEFVEQEGTITYK